MRKRFRFITTFLLTVSLLFSAGCGKNEPKAAQKPDSIINGKEIYFIEDSERAKWVEPLSRLLANVMVPYGENGEILGYKATVDEQAPSIPQCYECGLLDVTGDGVPELLVHPFGFFGSSGTATYFAYNIFSGQKVGEINGGNGQSWCFYLDVETNAPKLIGHYWLRGGWQVRSRYVKTVYYEDSVSECMETTCFHTYHEIDAEQTNIKDIDGDIYEATWVESYPKTEYYVGSREVYLDEYYAEYESFLTSKVRINETELVLIGWDDVSNEEDDYPTKAKKMANALVLSEQEFLKLK